MVKRELVLARQALEAVVDGAVLDSELELLLASLGGFWG